ncbi:MAG: heme-binding protein [Spirochaetaceae bacterium]|jgi:uncharacterized protein (UPF0303 family)|nr:heme-binding protein [Spirochaetaceae bacterium]
MSKDNYIKIVEAQEALLQFPHFSRGDAWDLGNLIAAEIHANKLPASVSIRLTGGFVLFQYAAEGTTPNNEAWMTRKFNTLIELGESGLLTALRLREKDQTIEDRGLNQRDHCASGGSFPIRLKGTGVIGAALVSGLFHFLDHGLLVDNISRHLKLDKKVPRLPPDAL